MPVENATPNRAYPLPDVANDLDFDVYRIINALTAVDLDMAIAFTSLSGKASAVHVHAIADVTGLQAALDGKAAATHAHALDGLTDVNAPAPGTNHVIRFTGTEWASGALSADWIALGTLAEARLPAWLSQASLNAKANLAGATFTGDLFVSKATPALGIVAGADQMRMILAAGIAALEAPAATGRLYLSALSGGDLTELKARFAGAWQDLLHAGLKASQAEAEAATDDARYMTPLKTDQAITKRWGTRTISNATPSGGADGDVWFQI